MRHVVRALHQRDLGLRLDHAAAGGDRRRRRRTSTPARRLADAVGDEEAHALFDADPAVLQRRGPSRCRRSRAYGLSSSCQTRTSSPNSLDQLARAVFLEARADVAMLAFGGMTTPNVRSLWPQRMPVK